MRIYDLPVCFHVTLKPNIEGTHLNCNGKTYGFTHTFFQHFPSWKTVITHLQELVVKGDAVKFLLKKVKE